MAGVTPRTIIITKMPNRLSTLVPASRMLVTATPTMSLVNRLDASCDSNTRKRRRLTHLSPDERMMRRKLKNRVAAQTARDRKKQRMDELEEALAELEAENKLLQKQNKNLIQRSQNLNEENLVLREHLGLDAKGNVPSAEKSTNSAMLIKSEPGSPESAALKLPLQQEQIQTLFTTASHYMAMILTLSLISCCNYSSKSVVARETKHPQSLIGSPLPLAVKKEPSVTWWGPHQQSWNPSMN